MPALQLRRPSRRFTSGWTKPTKIPTTLKQATTRISPVRINRANGARNIRPYLDAALLIGCGFILIRAAGKFLHFIRSGKDTLNEASPHAPDAAVAREDSLDKTLADSFPSSDPPSSIPDPQPVSPESTLALSTARKGKG